jgi:copper(I)-binding protein
MFSDINEELKNKKYLYIKLNFKKNGSIEIPFQIKKNNIKGHVNHKH